ncbi:hypothetical protein [Rothia nasimurium]|uniref:hypothetical protein n=1 Tax=Rothia nasimurium TaxID=85336 RepID=UPI001F2B117F|nr:hypothetical protein [Rothia nasimurium]
MSPAPLNLENWHKLTGDKPDDVLYYANRWRGPHLDAQLTYTPGEENEQIYFDASLHDGTLEEAVALADELQAWLTRVHAGERYAHIEGLNPWEYTHYLTGTGARFCGWDPENNELPTGPVKPAGDICPNCREAYQRHQVAALNKLLTLPAAPKEVSNEHP